MDLALVRSFRENIHLIMGGTDKNLDFSVLKDVVSRPAGVYLLQGSGTDKMLPMLREQGVPFSGPFDCLESAVHDAFSRAGSGEIILLSPGCASFGMFRNEFHRGDTFRDIVKSLA